MTPVENKSSINAFLIGKMRFDEEIIENINKNSNGGAGTKSAELVAELGATQVISGDFGPKAKSLLEKMKIQMVIIL